MATCIRIANIKQSNVWIECLKYWRHIITKWYQVYIITVQYLLTLMGSWWPFETIIDSTFQQMISQTSQKFYDLIQQYVLQFFIQILDFISVVALCQESLMIQKVHFHWEPHTTLSTSTYSAREWRIKFEISTQKSSQNNTYQDISQ